MDKDWRNELITKGAAFDAQEVHMAIRPLDGYEDGLAMLDILRNLPPAQPEWIPVTERLPEEKQDVLLAFKHNMVVGFWEDILDNGEPAWYANSGDGWMTGTESVDSDGIPIAWMPLPEPYKGE